MRVRVLPSPVPRQTDAATLTPRDVDRARYRAKPSRDTRGKAPSLAEPGLLAPAARLGQPGANLKMCYPTRSGTQQIVWPIASFSDPLLYNFETLQQR
jgi:hypothetical protein